MSSITSDKKTPSAESTDIRTEKAVPIHDDTNIEEGSSAAEKALTKKLDLRLIPIIMLLYLFSFLDRGTTIPFLAQCNI